MAQNALRVLLVDDNRLAREAMREIVAAEPGFAIVGEAASGVEAWVLTERLCPDLVLMDVDMPGLGGFETAAAIRAGYPHIRIVMATASDDPDYPLKAQLLGLQGCLAKNLEPSVWKELLRGLYS